MVQFQLGARRLLLGLLGQVHAQYADRIIVPARCLDAETRKRPKLLRRAPVVRNLVNLGVGQGWALDML
jgi:hypothetical protein